MEDTANKRNSILIVDDEVMNLSVLSGILRDDYDVRTASSGFEALEKADEDPPDLILLDVMMPDMNGYETLDALKKGERTWSIPVIFITGLDSKEDEEKGLALDAADYISKPFSAGIVKLRVENQIQILNQLRTIEALSLVDQLTGIPNRRNLDSRFSVEWSRALREKQPISLLMMDIDKFKLFNDTYGHLIGDEVLKMVAASFKHSLKRKSDFAARFGGEEFSVLLPNTPQDGAIDIAERIRKGVQKLVIPCGDGKTTKVTLSIGVCSCVPTEDESIDEIISKADQALYTAKETGRNRVCAYDSGSAGAADAASGKLKAESGKPDAASGKLKAESGKSDAASGKLKAESGKPDAGEKAAADESPQLSTFSSQLSTPGSCSGIIEKIGKVGAINLEVGMSHFSNMDNLYVETVEVFCERIPVVTGDMDAAMADGDINKFGISVHSMKSMLSTVGATSISRMAAKLEDAAKRDDMQYCRDIYPDLRRKLEDLHGELLGILSPAAQMPPVPEVPGDGDRKKIIHVDDVTYTLVSLKGRLEKYFEIYSVRSYEQLFKVLDKLIPDMILLDVRMPGMDGFEIIRELKSNERYNGIPVVFLTSVNDDESVSRCMELGAADVIIKPIPDAELVRRISERIV